MSSQIPQFEGGFLCFLDKIPQIQKQKIGNRCKGKIDAFFSKFGVLFSRFLPRFLEQKMRKIDAKTTKKRSASIGCRPLKRNK